MVDLYGWQQGIHGVGFIKGEKQYTLPLSAKLNTSGTVPTVQELLHHVNDQHLQLLPRVIKNSLQLETWYGAAKIVHRIALVINCVWTFQK